MILGDATGIGAVVLLVVLVVGVLAGRAKGRWLLLLVGLVAAAVLGLALAGTMGVGLEGGSDPAARYAGVWAAVLPPVVAFVAGWLLARGSWFRRVLVVAAAVVLLAAFPYAAAGAATADLLP